MIRLLAVSSCLAVAVPAVANPPPQIDRSRGVAPNNEDGPTERSPAPAPDAAAPAGEQGAASSKAPAPNSPETSSTGGSEVTVTGLLSRDAPVPLEPHELDLLNQQQREAYRAATLTLSADAGARAAIEARESIASRLSLQPQSAAYYRNLTHQQRASIPAEAYQRCLPPQSSVLGIDPQSMPTLQQAQGAAQGAVPGFEFRTDEGCLQSLQAATSFAAAQPRREPGAGPQPQAPGAQPQQSGEQTQRGGGSIPSLAASAVPNPPPSSPRPTSRIAAGAAGAFIGGVAGVIANGAGAAAFLGVPPLAVIAVAAIAVGALLAFLGGGRRGGSRNA